MRDSESRKDREKDWRSDIERGRRGKNMKGGRVRTGGGSGRVAGRGVGMKE
jgi:hypothetical protein